MIEKICIIALANILFYAKTITYQYCSDDIPVNHRPKSKSKWKHWLEVLRSEERHSTQVDHLITILIHTLICIFIYIGFGSNNISFIAALLFSFNPANNQVAVWIAGRPYALSAMGLVASMSMPFCAPLFLLGSTYFNAGFAAPIVFIASPWWWFIFFLPFIWIYQYKRFKSQVLNKVSMEMYVEDRSIKPEKFVLAIKTFGFYTIHALIPIKTTFYHSFLQSAAGSQKDKAYTMNCRFFWIGIIFIISIISYLILHRWDLTNFALVWWVMGILPFCNFIRIQQEIAERYMYLPNIGLMYFVSSILYTNPVMYTAFITMYATKMWFYMDCYHDDFYLTEVAALNSPQSWFAWHVKAMKRWDAKSHQEAVIYWTMARNISPKEFKLNMNLASALKLGGLVKESDSFYKIAMENIPAGQEKQVAEITKGWNEGQCAILL